MTTRAGGDERIADMRRRLKRQAVAADFLQDYLEQEEIIIEYLLLVPIAVLQSRDLGVLDAL